MVKIGFAFVAELFVNLRIFRKRTIIIEIILYSPIDVFEKAV